MKFCSENWSDIQKYFQGTYMKFPTFAGDTIHYINRVREDLIEGTYQKDGESVPFQFNLYRSADHAAPDVEFLLPQKSWFQYGPRALFLYRIPARQYKRGVSNENTAVAAQRGDSTLFDNIGVDIHVLSAYAAKPAFPLLSSLDKGSNTSWALSPRIAVSQGGRLFVDMFHAGTVDWNTKRVVMHESIFTDEVKQVAGDFVVGGDVKEAPKPRKVASKYMTKGGDLDVHF